MRLSTTLEAPAHITNPVPAALSFKQALAAAMYPPMQQALSSIRSSATAKSAGSYYLSAIDDGGMVGFGIGSTWPKWWTKEYDMPAHEIAAKNAPYLVFEGREGHLVRVKSVQHPGHQGNMAVHDAVGVAEAQIRAAIPGAVRVIWTDGSEG